MNIKTALKSIQAPLAAVKARRLEHLGDVRIDPYYWLNQRESREVTDYLEAENAYLRQVMAHTRGLQEELYTEITGRIQPDDESCPYFKNGFYYQSSFSEGQEYPVYKRMRELNAEAEIILDVNELAVGQSYCQVSGLSVSPDNRYLLFGIDLSGRRQYQLRIKDLQSGEMLSPAIGATAGYGVWSADSCYIFYPFNNPETLRAEGIKRHKLGTDAGSDVLVYRDADESFYVSVKKSRSEKYILIASESTLSSEYRYLPAAEPLDKARCFESRERGHEYSLDHRGEHFFILSNWEARNFRLLRCPEADPRRDRWEEIVAHQPEVLIQDFLLFSDSIILQERFEGLVRFLILQDASGQSSYLPFEEAAYVADFDINPQIDSRILRFNYTSLTTPHSIFEYDRDSGHKKLLKQQKVLGDFSPADYVIERLQVALEDGATLPISLVCRRDYKEQAKKPLLLYGYGSYGISVEPTFSLARLSLLDRGFAFAIAHIRGGQEMGRHWYESGRQLDKMNTFHDFIRAAEYLVQEGYADRDQLYAYGGSAGGLLVGTVMNLRPDLWAGLIAAVPFVDVVTTMLDESIPLTTGEYDEWGNPNQPVFYTLMKSYSPYDNVQDQPYPPLLITTGLHDSQVQYWEPAKWAAKLRALPTHPAPVLLHCDMSVGHGGSAGRFERFKETALQYAFLLDLAGSTQLLPPLNRAS